MHHLSSKLFRQGLIAAAFVLQFVLLCTGAFAASPAQDGYNPDVDGLVYTSVIQPDGKLVIGGSFTKVKDADRKNLARLNVDGSVDTSFVADVDGPVTAMIRLYDGSLIIGGQFGTVKTLVRRGLARISSGGVVDTLWKPGLSYFSVPSIFRVKALALQQDGKLLVGGHFDTFYPDATNVATTVAKANILRLNSNGSLDTTFTAAVDDVVMAIAVRPDNRIVAAGGFTKVTSTATPTTVGRIARFSQTGVYDPTFLTTYNNRVNVLLNDPDGGLYVGGAYTAVTPVNPDTVKTTPALLAAARSVNNLTLLDNDGCLSTTFGTTANGEILALALQPDGALLVGGNISEIISAAPYTRATVSYVGRVLPTGFPDQTFFCGANQVVTTIQVQSDGNILLGGYFARIMVAGDTLSTPRNHVARVQPDGTLDSDFSPAPSGVYDNVQVLANGSFLLNGSFNDIAGATRNGLAVMTPTGVIQTNFSELRTNGAINAAALVPDGSGSAIIGGTFTRLHKNGESATVTRSYIAKILASGAVDTTWTPDTIDGALIALAIQPDGKIIISGKFNTIGTTSQYYMARLDKDGKLDTTFNPAPSLPPSIIRMRGTDGKIWIAGDFTFLNPNKGSAIYRPYLAVLNSDGTVDTSFTTVLNGTVTSFSEQSDGKLYVAGGFNSLSVTVNGTARTISGIARLNADGSLDNGFVVQTDNPVSTVWSKGDWVYLGGAFANIYDTDFTTKVPLYYMARVSKDGAVDKTFNPNPDGLVRSIIPVTSSSDSKLLVVGTFSSFKPTGEPNSLLSLGLAVVTTNGTSPKIAGLDSTFKPSAATVAGDKVNFIVHEPGASLLVGGKFAGINGATTNNLMRVSNAGRRITSFSASPNGEVSAGVTLPVETQALNASIGFTWLKSLGTTEQVALSKLPALTGYVFAIGRQADGRLILAGSFYITDNTTYTNLIRLNLDGALDTTFKVTTDGAIYSVLVDESNDSLVLGGAFTTVKGSASDATAVSRSYMARVDKNGALDLNFNPTFDALVRSIITTADKKSFIVGGAFTTVKGLASATATSRAYIAKIAAADGALDTAFTPYANAQVNVIVRQPSDDKLILAGNFTSIQGTSATSYTTRSYLARLNADGSLDTAFDPAPNDTLNTVVLESDGNILVGGSFTSFKPNGATTATERKYLARLAKADGVVNDLDFKLDGAVSVIAIQSNGTIVIGGNFTTVKEVNRSSLASVSSAGVVGGNFAALPSALFAISILSGSATPALNDSIVLGGSFSRARTTPFMVIGGSFDQVSDYAVVNLARLYIDGGVDQTFLPNPNGKVNAIVRQSDGSLIVGGAFTKIAGADVSYIARFKADGTLDTAFAPALGGVVNALALTPEGKILVGGAFTGKVRLLTSSGGLDSSASYSFTADVTSLATLPNGTVLVGSASSPYFGAFKPVESLPTLPAVTGGAVNTIAVAADGSYTIAGDFTKVGDTTVSRFARVKADGSVDTSNVPGTINGSVTTMMITEDGKTMLGGAFTSIDDLPRFMLARLAPPAQNAAGNVQRITYDEPSKRIIWIRSGFLPLLTSAILESSVDDVNWTFASDLVRSGSNWSASQGLDASKSYNLRVRGVLQSAPGGSSGIVSSKINGTGAQLAGKSLLSALYLTTTDSFSLSLTSLLGYTPLLVTGLPAGISWDPVTGIISGTPTAGSKGDIVVSWFDGVYNRTSLLGYTVVATNYVADASQRIANMSARVFIPAGGEATPGLVIKGTAPKTLLLRAVGPGLAGFGVTSPLPNPVFELRRAGTAELVIPEVGPWGGDAALKAAAARLGAFALVGDLTVDPVVPPSLDAAVLVTLQPGDYTITVKDKNGVAGVVLIEAYDDDISQSQQLVNISTRHITGIGSQVLTGGFVLKNARQRVLIRAVGPSLGKFGVTGFMPNPTLTLFKDGVRIAANGDWGTQSSVEYNWIPLSKAAITSVTAAVGAFPLLESDSQSAVLLMDLDAGLYTFEVGSSDGINGSVIFEVYQVQ